MPVADLVQNTSDGPLPKVAADGTRPLDAYARPVGDVNRNDMRIAIVIGGIGIDADGSHQAIDLPGAVTLAFAPYGKDLKGTLADARNAGHEVLLQIPMEPFNYPSTNPGPHTLTVDAPASQNIDRLHWLMGRVTNYVGVVNYMGARFTSDDAALAPVLADIGKRGLLYLDDGSSARSRAGEIARQHAGTPRRRGARRRPVPPMPSTSASTSCAPSPASAAMPSPPARLSPPPSTGWRRSPSQPPTAASLSFP